VISEYCKGVVKTPTFPRSNKNKIESLNKTDSSGCRNGLYHNLTSRNKAYMLHGLLCIAKQYCVAKIAHIQFSPASFMSVKMIEIVNKETFFRGKKVQTKLRNP